MMNLQTKGRKQERYGISPGKADTQYVIIGLVCQADATCKSKACVTKHIVLLGGVFAGGQTDSGFRGILIIASIEVRLLANHPEDFLSLTQLIPTS